jgi:hypothetical protein
MAKWLKWILITLTILVALVGATAAIGALIERDHVASRTALYAQSAEAVWSVITDFEGGPAWREGLERVERGADVNGHPVWVEHGEFGPMALEVAELDPPRRMVTRIADESLPFGGTWTFAIEPEGEGCRLTITERGSIYNPIFRFMSRYIFGYAGAMESYLRSLGRKFGEEVVPAS